MVREREAKVLARVTQKSKLLRSEVKRNRPGYDWSSWNHLREIERGGEWMKAQREEEKQSSGIL